MKLWKESEQAEARRQIIAAANKHRIDATIKPYSMRTLQSAVCAVRRRQLVKPDVLIIAGFRP